MSSTSTSHTGNAARTSTSTLTYTAPPSYAPSDASSVKSTSSTVKKHLVSVFTKKLDSSSASSSSPSATTKGPIGKDGLTAEQRRIRNEARAYYYSAM